MREAIMLDFVNDDFDDDEMDDESTEDFGALLEQYGGFTPETVKVGQRVRGTILSIGDEFLFVDIGTKSEAIIDAREYRDKDGEITVQTGDEIEAVVVSTQSNEIVLSNSMSSSGKSDSSELIAAMNSELPVQGKVLAVNKGGFDVEVMGRKAFCPISQIDTRYVVKPEEYRGQVFTFVITQVSEGGRNVVVSRLPVLKGERDKTVERLKGIAEQNGIVKGKITRIAPFGLFVDLGGIDGLVHISEVSWDHTDNLKELYNVGDQVECVVLGVEQKRSRGGRSSSAETRISLSLKQVAGDPWVKALETLKPGQIVKGQVTRLMKFGVFVSLMPGVEGLVHISELRWEGRVNHPAEVVSEGQDVEVTILSIDEDKRNVSCSLKQALPDPWQDIEKKYAPGMSIAGTVVNRTNFGYFVNIEDGVVALLPHSSISPDYKDTDFPEGSAIEAEIESVEPERRRISLSYGMAEAKKEEQAVREYMADQRKKEEDAESELAIKVKAALEAKK